MQTCAITDKPSFHNRGLEGDDPGDSLVICAMNCSLKLFCPPCCLRGFLLCFRQSFLRQSRLSGAYQERTSECGPPGRFEKPSHAQSSAHRVSEFAGGTIAEDLWYANSNLPQRGTAGYGQIVFEVGVGLQSTAADSSSSRRLWT